ncbi:MAG: bifunctional glutamate N-acetyltransferase/amino-acid acetyltransferase ArgJ [Clostridiales bacterium]|nr:bifunctional glutamate N-acetyltransferase/amino-acid acetyltransferase ArgJ [Clostridiales bacterium]
MISKICGGVTSAHGFKAAHTAAGIKSAGKPDMAMIVSEVSCKAAGTFTSNVVKAAPVIWDREVTGRGMAQAVVINSGIANACTGKEGMDCCRQTAGIIEDVTGIPAEQVLVASTGIIGKGLPMEKIRSGIEEMIPALDESCKAGHAAAGAILTTDTHEKEAAVSFEIGGKTVVLGGMCKGSGMIHPNMCTMLAFLTTDINIDGRLLKEALSTDIIDTYNMISVDGDTSTNDTVLLLANGLAGNPVIDEKNGDYEIFCEALHMVNETLAKMIAGDGEGATALLEAHVINAESGEKAKILAKSIICSNLTKATIFGHDANFGRVLCAMGYSGVDFDPDKVKLCFESAAGHIDIFAEGKALDFSEEEATKILSEPEVTVVADMGEGESEARAWGCDLTYEYVHINADYRS